MMPAETTDFETTLSELEKIVRELEGEVKLERALQLFEHGVKLSTAAEAFLVGAEQKIEILKKQSTGELLVENFAEAES